jgi:uncharacterized protein YndB with AHSA1/START domain
MRTQGSVTIDRPIDEVFRLTNDDVSKWSIIVVENEELETTPEGVGSTFRIVTEERGQRMEFDGVVTEYDPPRASAIHMTGKMFDIAAEYTFEDLGGSTRVTQISSVHGKGLAKVMFLCFGWMMRKSSCRALEEELNSLKLFCETEAQVPS